MTMHGYLCAAILNTTWPNTQDGGLVIFNTFLQYGYQMKKLPEKIFNKNMFL